MYLLYNSLNNGYCQKYSFKSRFPSGDKRPQHVKESIANQSFSRYNPSQINYQSYTIPVHNDAIKNLMCKKYDVSSFNKLFNFAIEKGVFDYTIEKNTGFVKTSWINHKENPLMSDLVWITDSCHNMELLKIKNPKDCPNVLNKLAGLYEHEMPSFDNVIKNPTKYKHNGFWPQEANFGVGHCFDPTTKTPHHWFAKTRLESVGNYLQMSSDVLKNGFEGAEYGYKSAEEVPDKVLESISACTKYLKAINYPAARSCGAWEEQTFVNSLSSDTAIINQGLRDTMNLMYSECNNNDILNIRERILKTKHGDVFEDKEGLDNLLKSGEQRIREQYQTETQQGFYTKKVKPWEEKCLSRDFDAAMSYIYQTETIDNDIYKDSAKKLLAIKKLSNAVVRPNGAVRYVGDEYLNLDYHNKQKQHNKDKALSKEAEWFLVSEIACAYGAVAHNLINYAKENNLDKKGERLLDIAMNGQTEFINRSYARITPKNVIKSNGYTCPAYKVPEAYEAVSLKNGKIKYVPGAHTLTWAESSLYKASEYFKNNLTDLQLLELKKDKKN